MRAIALAALLCFAGPVFADDDFAIEDRQALRAEIRAYLLENPEILREAMAALEAKEALAQVSADKRAISANASALFDDGFSYV
ncbi:MAG: DsbA family protein, partial [Pseudomonadota bacterium]